MSISVRLRSESRQLFVERERDRSLVFVNCCDIPSSSGTRSDTASQIKLRDLGPEADLWANSGSEIGSYATHIRHGLYV